MLPSPEQKLGAEVPVPKNRTNRSAFADAAIATEQADETRNR
jgi:hypothetical protein